MEKILQEAPNIKKLEIVICSFDETSGRALWKVLSKRPLLEKLRIYNTDIWTPLAGAPEDLSKFMEETKLQELLLQGTNLGTDGIVAIAKGLQGNKHLKILGIVDRPGIKGIQDLVASLRVNTTITELVLRESHLTTEMAVEIADLLQHSHTIKRLDLSNNNVGPCGGQALAAALETNSTLKRLDLSLTNIGTAGAVALGKALVSNRALKLLDISFCHIGQEGIQGLCDGLVHNTSLRKLGCAGNGVESSIQEMTLFKRALTSNLTVTLRLQFDEDWQSGDVRRESVHWSDSLHTLPNITCPALVCRHIVLLHCVFHRLQPNFPVEMFLKVLCFLTLQDLFHWRKRPTTRTTLSCFD